MRDTSALAHLFSTTISTEIAVPAEDRQASLLFPDTKVNTSFSPILGLKMFISSLLYETVAQIVAERTRSRWLA